MIFYCKVLFFHNETIIFSSFIKSKQYCQPENNTQILFNIFMSWHLGNYYKPLKSFLKLFCLPSFPYWVGLNTTFWKVLLIRFNIVFIFCGCGDKPRILTWQTIIQPLLWFSSKMFPQILMCSEIGDWTWLDHSGVIHKSIHLEISPWIKVMLVSVCGGDWRDASLQMRFRVEFSCPITFPFPLLLAQQVSSFSLPQFLAMVFVPSSQTTMD